MYTINHNKYRNTVEIRNTSTSVYGKIHLNDGGSLQELILNDKVLIADLKPLSYKTTYASAILFPFANRIENGQYCFNEEQFQLETNEKEENNALHGLVYNKPFEVKKQFAKNDSAELILQYMGSEKEKGFPYAFAIELTYVFKNDSLDLRVEIKNNGIKTFPFTVGWHPYFLSEHLGESKLKFESTKKVEIGNRNIAQGLVAYSGEGDLSFGSKDFDDCWLLNTSKVIFMTPKYQLDITTSEPNSFLQVYTPPKPNVVAIEPTTGVSNSFNNKIGLRTLAPNEVFKLKWGLKIHVN